MPTTGQVQGLCKIVDGTPAPFCRVLSAGTYRIDPHNSEAKGIGDQLLSSKGTTEVELTGLECEGIANSDLALWCPTSAGVQVADFPDFLVAADGTDGMQWVMSSCQPGGFSMRMDAGPDARLKFTLGLKGIPTPQAAETATPVYTNLSGYERGQVSILFGGQSAEVLSIDLSNDLTPEMYDPLEVREPQHMTEPLGYYIRTQTPRLRVTTGKVFKAEAALFADEHTPQNVVITCDNGKDTPLVVVLTDFIPGAWSMAMTPDGLVAFDQEFQPASGTISNRIRIGDGS